MLTYKILANLTALVVFIIGLNYRLSYKEAESIEEKHEFLLIYSFYVVGGWILIFIGNW
jgi:hypothetical protein